jgi:hypothetical protein
VKKTGWWISSRSALPGRALPGQPSCMLHRFLLSFPFLFFGFLHFLFLPSSRGKNHPDPEKSEMTRFLPSV